VPVRTSRARFVALGVLALGVAVVIVILTQSGSGQAAPASAAPPSITGLVAAGKPLHVRVGDWKHDPTSYAYQWQTCPGADRPCVDVPGATAATYTPALTDDAQSFRVRVTARNLSGRASAWSAQTSVLAAAQPGAPGPPVSCTTTLQAGADLPTALAHADPGQVLCLDAGDWGDITLSDVSPAGNVTLAAAPGQTVHLHSLTIEGQSDAPSPTDNLTVRGFWIDRGVQDLTDTTGGLVFEHNTIARIRQGYGFYFDPDGNGGSHAQAGVIIANNRISQVGECLAVTGSTSGFSFDHNVCGPGIGYGDTASTDPGHYIEVGGSNDLAVDDNTFTGPAAPSAATAGLHLNVFHLFGGGRNIDFSHNVLWHTQARGQALLLQEGHFDDVRIDDNLDVEDPACGQHSECANYMAEVSTAHGLSFSYNTVVGASYGVLITASGDSAAYTTGSGYTVTHNVVVGAQGAPAISYGGCSSACEFDYNVTDDDSAAEADSVHSVTHWTPAWVPDTRYRPAGLSFAAGVQPDG
jgi:hypothetical protein